MELFLYKCKICVAYQPWSMCSLNNWNGMSQNICLQSQTVIKLEERVIVGRKTTQIVTHDIFLRPTCGLQND